MNLSKSDSITTVRRPSFRVTSSSRPIAAQMVVRPNVDRLTTSEIVSAFSDIGTSPRFCGAPRNSGGRWQSYELGAVTTTLNKWRLTGGSAIVEMRQPLPAMGVAQYADHASISLWRLSNRSPRR
jgi:hypothetical protein